MTHFSYLQALSIASTNINPCNVTWVAKIQSFYVELQNKALLKVNPATSFNAVRPHSICYI
jgi:hypothetical protein